MTRLNALNGLGTASIGWALPNIPQPSNYPPYNIIQVNENEWRIEVSVAGFSPNDIEVTRSDKELSIKTNKETDKEITYRHNGISNRNFERKFLLGEHVEINGVEIVNGILVIDLEQKLPEEKKPTKFEIKTK